MEGSKTTKAQERPVRPKALAGLGIFLYPIDLPTSSDDFAVVQRSKARHWPAHVIHGLSATCTLTQKLFLSVWDFTNLRCLTLHSRN